MMIHKAISLFSGGGGMDCGLARAGFDMALSSDIEDACASTLGRNGLREVLHADISNVTAADVLSIVGSAVGSIDLLAAGPPCQPFSKSANWRNGSPLGFEDPRSDTLGHMMRIIEGVLPRVVLFENVPGFAGKGGLDAIQSRLIKINRDKGVRYSLTSAIIDAAAYGVPQHRKRLIVILDRDGRHFTMPRPTHGELASAHIRTYVTAWEAIGDLDKIRAREDLRLRGRWADLLASIPEGENYLWHTDRGQGLPLFGYRTRYWNFLLKLAKSRPAWTLSANPSQNSGPFHWKNRLLSIDELSRLQSFPDSWRFEGSRAQMVRQIGNAVPPILAFVIGREIRRQLLGHKGTSKKAWARSADMLPAPAPERIMPVEEKYLRLAGRHQPHPGHGLGPGALRRLKEFA